MPRSKLFVNAFFSFYSIWFLRHTCLSPDRNPLCYDVFVICDAYRYRGWDNDIFKVSQRPIFLRIELTIASHGGSLIRLRQELTTLILNQSKRITDPLKSATFKSSMFDMILQATNVRDGEIHTYAEMPVFATNLFCSYTEKSTLNDSPQVSGWVSVLEGEGRGIAKTHNINRKAGAEISLWLLRLLNVEMSRHGMVDNLQCH